MMHSQARERIRTARIAAGVSLRELGRRVGVSASLLSQIENGKSDPSVSTLYALVSELGLSLDALLDPADPAAGGSETVGVAGRGGNGPHRSPVVQPGERRTLDMDSGVTWERLTRGPTDFIHAMLITYAPGGTSSSSGKLMTHTGLEYAYLMDGELTLQLGFETYRVRAGDSLEFQASTPHLYVNRGKVPAKGVWCVLGKETVPPPGTAVATAGGIGRGQVPGPRRPPNSAIEALEAFRQE